MALGTFKGSPTTAFVFVVLLMLIALPGKAEAFGAGSKFLALHLCSSWVLTI